MAAVFAILLAILSIGLFIGIAVLFLKSQKLEAQVAQFKKDIASVHAESSRIRAETEQGVEEAQKLIDQQVAELKAETERVRQHYESESRKSVESVQAQLATALRDVETFKKYESLHNAEEEVRRTLADAVAEATSLRNQAQALMEQARTAAERERLLATEKARVIYEQADARLIQATHDAGRIISEAEIKAQQVGREAYNALRDKQLLERAAEAIRNTIEGYGDRYIVPTHSLLDDLAIEFGYTSAGESLKSARAQTRRMVEQGEAAACEYTETNRKETAIRFVINAFNGRVDAILSRVKRDNFGTLEQEIRDAFSLVNLDGKAFRDARILPAYLDARLSELKWAVVVQELARQQLEEQRDIKARMRDEEKARKEREEQLRQAAKEEEIKRKAVEEKERELAAAKLAFERASAEDKAQLQQQIAAIQSANEALRQDLAAATEKALTIAQQTKKGHVYIISNIGSFGEGIYKIGQTRRLDPQERIDELGDASVPFSFDVHAWIESDNAPVLEHKLQKCFLAKQVNKINSRKEFFRVKLGEIRAEVEKLNQGEEFTVKGWTELAAATQYRETLDIESNPEKLEKWLKREDAETEREIRLDTMRLSDAEVSEPL